MPNTFSNNRVPDLREQIDIGKGQMWIREMESRGRDVSDELRSKFGYALPPAVRNYLGMDAHASRTTTIKENSNA